MGLSFFETMSGELRDPEGACHHVHLDLRCAARRALAIVGGRFHLDGTISSHWGEAACTGTLELSPRRLEYRLEFEDEEGARLHLLGRKRPDPRAPLASMTTLRTTLERQEAHGGRVRLAEGTLRFHLDELPSFLAGFGLDSTMRPVDLSGTGGLAVLSPKERAAWRELAEAVLRPGQRVPPVDEQTMDRAEQVLGHTPGHLLPFFRAGIRLLAKAGPERALKSAVGRAGVYALSMPLKGAHYSRPDFLKATGMPDYRNPVAEPPPSWMSQVHTPEELEPSTRMECDVVVVGTGAGGGPVAAALAEAGLAVLLVEEGRYRTRQDFAGPPEERLLSTWRDGGVCASVGNLPLLVPTGRMVGGSTAINSGTCYRTPDAVLEEWRGAGLPADFDPEGFGPWLDQVESELQVEAAPSAWLGDIAQAVFRGADAMGAVRGPLRRNAPGCDGQGLCVVGCPTDAKRSSNVSWVPRALRAGAELVTGLPVTRVLFRGKQAIGVLAEGQDDKGASRRVEVRARAVVLACGALHTPLLLQRNGVRLPRLGKGLSVHPALGAYALFEESLGEPWRAIPQSVFVEGLVDKRVRFEGFYAPPQIAAATLPMHGAELTRWMDQWDHVGQFGFMVRDPNRGSVTPGPGGRPLIRYDIGPEVLRCFREGSAVLAELLLRGGASEVETCIDGVGSVNTLDQARALAGMDIAAHCFRGMAFHPLGTCAMGADSRSGVVDGEHGVFGTEGLYVIDGASVPTSLGVNPQVTIMAMALRAADRLSKRLEA